MESEKVKEIKKIATLCVEKNKLHCSNCPKGTEDDVVLTCRSLLKEILTLINELEKENETKTDTITDLLKKQEFYEKEKLKQFAERLKEQAYDSFGDKVIWYNDIDETLKEFINEEI